jgi:hypothetical protein
MHPHDLPVAGHLHRVGDDRDLHAAAPPGVSDLIHGAGERQLSGAVDDPGHRHLRGRLACGPAALHRLSWLGVGFAALDMFGDQLCPLCQLRTGGSDMLLPPGIHSWQQTQWYEDASAGRPMLKLFGIPYCPDALDPVT